MGLNSFGTLGSVSGSVGPVVFCTLNDQDVVKGQPKKSNKPPVQAQIDQRERFKLVTTLLGLFKYFIDLGFKSGKKKASGMNAAVKYHLENAVTGLSPDFAFDFSEMVLSNGNLHPAESFTATAVAGFEVECKWDAYETHLSDEIKVRNTDLLVVLFYDPIRQRIIQGGAGIKRSDLATTLTIPRSFGTNLLHGWMFLISADLKKSSKSEYLGTLTAIPA